MRLVAITLLLALPAIAAPHHRARGTPDLDCSQGDWLQCLTDIAEFSSGGRILASYLTLSGGTVSTTGITFTRASAGAACTDASGNITFPATNVPCANSTGLHVRPSIANALTFSDDPSNAAWTKTNASATADTAVAPDGTTTADTVSTTAAGGYVYQTYSPGAYSGAISFSVYAEALSGTELVTVQIYDQTAAASLASRSCTATTSWPANSWSRCIVSVASTTVLHTLQFRFYPAGTAGSGSVYFWGAQAEKSAYVDDYCPSGATPTTCSIESAKVPAPAGFSLTVGCVKACLTPNWTGAAGGGFSIVDGNAVSNGTARFLYAVSTGMNAYDGTHVASLNPAGYVAGAHQCFTNAWSASGNSMAVTLVGGSSNTVAFSGWPSFASSFGLGTALTAGTNNLTAGLDTVEFGSSAGACR